MRRRRGVGLSTVRFNVTATLKGGGRWRAAALLIYPEAQHLTRFLRELGLDATAEAVIPSRR